MLKYEVRGRQIYKFVGEKLLCDRAYIFEWNHSDRMRNTYEWCAKGVVPQKHILQNESVESIQCLFPILEEKKVIVIDDMEQIGKQFNEKVRQLRRLIRKDEYHIAIGSAWSDQHPLQFDDLIAKADRMMGRAQSRSQVSSSWCLETPSLR